MVRGNQYLEFEEHEIEWEDHPRPRRPGRAGGVPHNPAPGLVHAAPNDPALGIPFLAIILIAPIVLGLAELAKPRPTATPAEQVRAESSRAPGTQVFPGTARAAAQAETPTAPVHVLHLKALDGRTYRIESRTGNDVRGELPPGFRLGYAPSELLLRDAPEGGVIGRVPQEARFLYTTMIYRQPCWRWLITLDGKHQGYVCPGDRGEAPAPAEPSAPSTYAQDGRTREALAAQEDPQPVRVAPHGYGCASVPGIVQTLSIGGGPPRKYQLPLCGPPEVQEPESRDKVYAVRDTTTAPTVVYKPQPEYSDEARKHKVQGTVMLEIEIDPSGVVAHIKVVRFLGFGLDEQAIAAVRQWRFTPALKDGQPVPFTVPVEVNFKLL